MGNFTATAGPSSAGVQQADRVTRAPWSRSVWELTEDEIDATVVAKAIVNTHAAAHLPKQPPLAEQTTVPATLEREAISNQTQQARAAASLQPLPPFDPDPDYVVVSG